VRRCCLLLLVALLSLGLFTSQYADAWSPATAVVAKKKCKKIKNRVKRKKCKKRHPATLAPATPPASTSPPPPPPQIDRVEIAPAGILLTGQGDSEQLTATAFDAQGDPVGGTPSFSSNDPGTVSVTGGGLATAAAGSGSAQITATVGGVSSGPILATVATPAAGALLITDSQVVSGPVLTDPNTTDPTFDSTFDVVVTGISPPALDTLVIDIESEPIIGRVVAVEDLGGGQIKLTLHMASTADAFPGLEIDETLDLSKAPVELNPEITSNFDVSHSGRSYTFTPKAGASAAAARSVSPRSSFNLGPFECEPETNLGGGNLPVALSTPPAFTVEVKPSLEVLWSADELEKLVVHLHPTVSMQAGITVTAAFEGKVSCKVELGTIVVPAGPLTAVFTGLIPFGVGLEASGKMNIADAGISGTASVAGTVDAGIVCPPPDHACSLTGQIHKDSSSFTPTLNSPSIGDVHFDPALSLFGYGEVAIGNAFFKQIRFDGAKGKLGLKLGGSFASKTSQIADTNYSSSYKLSLDGSAGLGQKLGDFAKVLGLGEVSGLEISASADLANSPTGTLTADHTTFQTGNLVKFKATLAGTDFFPGFGPYNVDHVVLVRNSGGQLTQVGSDIALPGETEFDFDFTAPDSGNVDEFYAFVVTNLLPLDLFSLEVARAVGQQPVAVSIDPTSVTVPPGGTQQFSATVTGTANQSVTWSASCGSVSSTGFYTAPNADAFCSVTATSVADSTKSASAIVRVHLQGTAELTGRSSLVEATDLERSGCTVFQNGGDFASFNGFGSFTGSASCTGERGTASASQNSDVAAKSDGAGFVTISSTASRTTASGQPISGFARSHVVLGLDVVGGTARLTCSGTVSADNADGSITALLDGTSFVFASHGAEPTVSFSELSGPLSGTHQLQISTQVVNPTDNPGAGQLESANVSSTISCSFDGPVTLNPPPP
jgi:hypothetical protein